jgi:SAM-dependent methyltransferase
LSPPEGPLEAPPCLLCGGEHPVPFLESRVQLAPGTGELFPFVSCSSCGLVYLSPRPTPEGMDRYYPPEYLPYRGPEAWGSWAPLVRRGEEALDRRRVRLVRRHLSLGPDSRVLDVGCGRPSFLHRLFRTVGARGVGLDVSDEGWQGETRFRDDLTLIRATLPAAEARLREEAPEGFHLITLWHALEHDHRPLESLEALRRLAAPDAVLVIEVPNLASLTARLHGSAWAGLHTPRHTAAYTPDTLVALVREACWRMVTHRSWGTLDPWILFWLGRQIERGRTLDDGVASLFPGFLGGKALFLPLTLLQRNLSLGVQTVVARRPPD